jgi:hypothetical protein
MAMNLPIDSNRIQSSCCIDSSIHRSNPRTQRNATASWTISYSTVPTHTVGEQTHTHTRNHEIYACILLSPSFSIQSLSPDSFIFHFLACSTAASCSKYNRSYAAGNTRILSVPTMICTVLCNLTNTFSLTYGIPYLEHRARTAGAAF